MVVDGSPIGGSWLRAVGLASLSFACGAPSTDATTNAVRMDTQPLEWSSQQVLDAPGETSVVFGVSVAIAGDLAAVGAPGDGTDDEPSLSNSGSAHVYARAAGHWTDLRRLRPAEPQQDAQFGYAVAATEGIVAVSAPFASSSGVPGHADTVQSGQVHLFRANGADWSAPGFVLTEPLPGDYRNFGSTVALDGTTLLVGAKNAGSGPGSAYVFVWNDTAWELEQELVPMEAESRDGDAFGSALALDGDTALVAAAGIELGKGVVYVFTRENGIWTQEARLIADDGVAADYFGSGVALSGDLAAVASPFTEAGEGGIYPFRRSSGTWTPDLKLVSPEPSTEGSFGNYVAAAGNIILASAPYLDSGVVFPFVNDGSAWSPAASESPSEPEASAFGVSLALSGATGIVGAPYGVRDLAFVYATNQGAPCTSDSDCTSGYCVEGVCCNTACDDLCSSCRGARKDKGSDGTCGPVAEGKNPRKAPCTRQSAATCGNTGVCDGQGACALYPSGTECTPARCVDDTTEASAEYCDGNGTCVPSETTACRGYECRDGACQQSCAAEADCVGDRFCNDSQRCSSKRGLGTECGADRECNSGHCTDGVCCAKACDGQCEACNEADSPGSCVAVMGKPRGVRDACPQAPADEPCAKVECDGQTRASCEAYAGADVVCQAASCKDGFAHAEQRCDGSGACTATRARACDEYACDQTDCFARCETEAQCVAGYYCEGGKCKTGSRCSSDEATEIHSDGTTRECSPFKCRDGACLEACTGSYDCTDPAVAPCIESTHECAPVEERMVTSSGCGCRLPVTPRAPSSELLALVSLALIFRRRARCAQRSSPDRFASVRPGE